MRLWDLVIGGAVVGIAYLVFFGESKPALSSLPTDLQAKVKELLDQHMADYPGTVNPTWSVDQHTGTITVKSTYTKDSKTGSDANTTVSTTANIKDL